MPIQNDPIVILIRLESFDSKVEWARMLRWMTQPTLDKQEKETQDIDKWMIWSSKKYLVLLIRVHMMSHTPFISFNCTSIVVHTPRLED